ncbi:MAG: TIGR03086 family metal-binding protein [Acidimicrobiales bacterium]
MATPPDDSQGERFRRVAGTFTSLAAAVPPEGWNRPAPCAGWSARDIVRHLVDWVPAVIGRSGLAFASGPGVDDDPAGAWAAVARTLQAALDDPAVAARTFDAGPPGELRIDTAIGMLVLGDVLVHSWDLAVATGQHADLDERMAAEMLAGMEPIDELLRGSGHYGPRVPADPDADAVSRLVAFTGRDPGWTPPPPDGQS